MQEYSLNTVEETKRLIKWIGGNFVRWNSICGRGGNTVAYFDTIDIIKELRQKEFYSQILNLVFNSQNCVEDIALSAILEEITETWGKEQWDEVIDKIIVGLDEAHQEAKKQRAQRTSIAT